MEQEKGEVEIGREEDEDLEDAEEELKGVKSVDGVCEVAECSVEVGQGFQVPGRRAADVKRREGPAESAELTLDHVHDAAELHLDHAQKDVGQDWQQNFTTKTDKILINLE